MQFKTLNDLLEKAIEGEVSSQGFYQASAEKASDPKIRDFLNSLVEAEKGHERMLLNIKEMEIYDGSTTVAENLLENAQKSHEIEITEIGDSATMEQICDIALKRENMAHNLYIQMAETTPDDELKELFHNLAKDELGHYKSIEKVFQAHKGEMGYEG